MKDKITTKQLMHTAAVFIVATSLVTKPLYTFMENVAWFAVIIGYLLSVLLYLAYISIARRFPGMTLIEINDAVFGRIPGKIVSAMYIFFFFTITCFDTNVISGFISVFMPPNTPMALILILFIFICCYAARKGAVNMMKYSALFIYLSTALLLLNGLLLYEKTDFGNLQPAFELPLKSYIFGSYSVTMLPLCDGFALLMLLPDMYRPKEFGKAMVKGLTVGAAVLLFIVLRDISILGPTSALETFPTYTSIRQIDVGDIFTRLDIIYTSILTALMFYKVAVLFYISISGVQRMMQFGSYRFLIYIFGALLLIYALIVFRTPIEHADWLVNGSAEYFQTFFLVIMPLLTMIVAVCRGFYGNKAPVEKKSS